VSKSEAVPKDGTDQSGSTPSIDLPDMVRPSRKYGPLAALFKRFGRPAITDAEHLKECVQALSDAIGHNSGTATLEMEEIGREAEVGIVELDGIQGGTIKIRGISRRVKLTVEKGPAGELRAVDIDFSIDEEGDDEDEE